MNDSQTQKLGIGILLSIIIVKILKNYFKIARPDINLKGYGFPSTRGAVIFFIITYLIFNNKLSKKTKILLLLIALFVCFLKYYMNEHSIFQLFCGALIGILISYILTNMHVQI
tara:strand:+ start:328 stop:669 length:342 start_codon:yes stop_codon:yes gene_type:complete